MILNWKGKIPPKIKKKLMWLLANGVILTEGNLIRENVKGGGPNITVCFVILMKISLTCVFNVPLPE